MENDILINDLIGLKEWAYSLHKFQQTENVYHFKLPGYSISENLKLSNQVNHYNKECGCKLGGLFMSTTFAIVLSHFFLTGGQFSSVTYSHVLWLIGLIILGALVGKGISLLHARWQLIKLSNRLMHKLKKDYNIEKKISF